MPFEREIQNRLVVKDNHRPCLPNPLEIYDSLPKCDENCTIPRDWSTYQETSFPQVHWRCCGEIEKY